MLFETSMFSAFGLSLVAERHSAEYEALVAAARRHLRRRPIHRAGVYSTSIFRTHRTFTVGTRDVSSVMVIRPLSTTMRSS